MYLFSFCNISPFSDIECDLQKGSYSALQTFLFVASCIRVAGIRMSLNRPHDGNDSIYR